MVDKDLWIGGMNIKLRIQLGLQNHLCHISKLGSVHLIYQYFYWYKIC